MSSSLRANARPPGKVHDAWQPMDTAPRDGTDVLLLLPDGVVQAHFSAGQWSDETPDHPREYDGAVWVCLDDRFQIEIEEHPGGYHDGEARGWSPVTVPTPAQVSASGEQLCRAFADTFSGGGWADPFVWEDFDEDGQNRWNRAAAALSTSLTASGTLSSGQPKAGASS